ncbi:MAG: PAS domain S-box protein [Candidatus Geothermincolia bacterium]
MNRDSDPIYKQFATFRGVIDTLDYPIFSVDSEYRYTSFNKAHAETMKALYGSDIELGMSILDCQTIEGDRERARFNMDRALAGERVAEEAYSGDDILSRHYFEVLHNPILDDAGQVIGVAISARDITERRKMEEALRDSEEKYRTLFENMLEGFAYCEIILDDSGDPADWRYLATNRAFEELTGLEGVAGRTVTEVLPGIREANPELFEIYGSVALSGVAREFETRIESLNLDLAIKVFSPARGYFVAVFENTTERNKSDNALRESEERYREIFEHATDGIFQSTPAGNYLSVNPAFAVMFGYESPEVMTGEVTDIANQLYADSRDREEVTRLLAEQGSVSGMELRFKRRDGGVICVALSAHAVLDNNGDAIFFEGTAVDITERAAAEASLRLARFELDNAGDMILRVDQDGRILFANEAAREHYGAGSDEMRSLHVWDVDRSLNEDNWSQRWQDRRAEGHTRLQGTWWQKDGKSYPVGLAISFLEFEGQEYIVAFARDISERKKSEEELAAAVLRYRELAETLPQVVFELDASGMITYINRNALEIFDYTQEEVDRGMHALDIIEAVDKERVSGAIEKMMDGRSEGAIREYLARRKDGTTFPARVYSSLVTDEKGNPVGVRGILTDISDHKRYENELEKANVELEGFAHTVSHDLRGPLTVIGFASELILQNIGEPPTEDVNAALAEAANLLVKNVSKANVLIEDLLSLARAGQEPSGVVEVDIAETVETVLDENASRLRRNKISVEVGEDLGTIRANPTHVYQVFANLIGNAVRHSRVPGALIEVKRLPDATEDMLRFLVRDNGPGIKPEALEKIFIPFFKGEQGGTGIGLSTVQKAVKVYGGWIIAYNDNGACFEFVMRDWQD